MSYYRGMNIASSLVQSFMYADMFNREYDGGAVGVEQEKIIAGGLPVHYIAPSLENDGEYTGGSSGPFENKVVPTGLVIINPNKERDVEYENYLYPGFNREVVSDSLYERLMGSVIVGQPQKKRKNPPKHVSKKKTIKKTSQKHKNN